MKDGFKSEYDVHISLLENMPKHLIDLGYTERHSKETIDFALNHFREKLDKLRLLRFKEYNKRNNER